MTLQDLGSHTATQVDGGQNLYEQVALRRLAENREVQHVAELTTLNGAPVFRYLQAAYADESCLECHGDPQQAPLFLREIFPPEQDAAYRYQVGEVIGAVSIVIPMAQIEKQLTTTFKSSLLTTSGFFIALVACLGLLMRKTVIDPLRHLAATLGTIRTTGHFSARLPVSGHDEIGELVCSFNAMAEELDAKTRHLEESEKRFRLLVETARDAIVAFLPAGQIFLVNRQAERIFGYSQQELLGEPVDRLFEVAPGLRAEGLATFLAMAAEPWFREVYLLKGVRQDQSPVQLEVSVTKVDTGERPFYTATLRERPGDAP